MRRLPLLSLLASLALLGASLGAQITTYPYNEDFESQALGSTAYNPAYTFTNGWTNVTGDNSNWTVDEGGTPSANTGPAVDHNPGTAAGNYVYFESSGGAAGNVAIARSPVFDWSALPAPRLTFWYHMWGATMGNMALDLIEAFNANTNGSNTTTTFTSATATFVAAHVGSRIRIIGGGNAGNYTIAAVVNSTTVTLATTPPGDLTGMTYVHELVTQNIVAPWTANQNVWQMRRVILTSLLVGGGSIRQFQFDIRGIQGTSFTSDMAFDDVTVDAVPANDMGVVSLDAPVSAGTLSATETVTITVRNYGSAAQSNIPVTYTINGGSPVNDVVPGPVAPGATAQINFATTGDFSADGTYTLVLSTANPGDADNTNDSITRVVFNAIAAPYFTDFESGAGGWATYGTTTFALGTPAGTIINSAFSGTNAWVTNLTGLYNNSETGGVAGPAIDLSAYTTADPWVFIRVWWNAEFSWDGAVLQSSIDGGQSWQNVGAFGDPNNWYTDNTIDGQPGGQTQGWSGRAATADGSNGWVLARHQLTGLGGQGSVTFRIAFGSDTSVVDEGFGFDDIFIGNPQEMNVVRGTSPVADGGTDTVNVLTAGTNLTYTIENLGERALTLTGTAPDYVVVTPGTNITSVTVTTQPTTPIAGGGSSNFVINVVPTAAGAYDFTVSIASEDFDENPYDFTVSGVAIANVPPTLTLATTTTFAAGSDFDLTLAPGATLTDANLTFDDATPDNVTVTITPPGTAPTGITPPAGGTTASGSLPGTLTWTGTADASNAPGAYTWIVNLNDGTSSVNYNVRIIITDVAPTHVGAAGQPGTADGSTANPYEAVYTEGLGTTVTVDLATVTDANTGQSLAITGTAQTSGPSTGSGFTFTLASGTTLQVAPTAALNANDVGVQVFDVTVSDGTNPVVITVEVTVNAAIVFTSSASLPDATQNTVYGGFNVTTTGGTGTVTFAITTGALPTGLSMAANGAVSGGTTAAPGNFTFTITATDSLGATSTQPANINVVAPAGGIPTITTTSPLTGGTVGSVYGPVNFAATGGTSPYTWALAPGSGALPAGLALGTGGDLTGTPTAAGTFGFTVRVTDSASVFADGAFSVTINAAPTGGGGGGDDDDDGGCAAGSTGNGWAALLALVPVAAVVMRRRRTA